jgi:hypothetical protein
MEFTCGSFRIVLSRQMHGVEWAASRYGPFASGRRDPAGLDSLANKDICVSPTNGPRSRFQYRNTTRRGNVLCLAAILQCYGQLFGEITLSS